MARVAEADRIELRGLRFMGAHGALAVEAVVAQPFRVDVSLHADLTAAAGTDSLANTVDYGLVCEAARRVVEGPHVALLERLAEQVAEAVLQAASPAAVAVEVSVRKLRPPVPYDLASAGVRVFRRPSVRAFLALGSNLGDRWAFLRRGLAGLPDVVRASKVYETDPVGGPQGQGPYLNMVAELRTRRSPEELLGAARCAEAAAGRERTERWGPRTLDVDILLYGERAICSPELQVPHPRMWQRGFVLVPLADLAPELVAGKLAPAQSAGVRLAGELEVTPGTGQ